LIKQTNNQNGVVARGRVTRWIMLDNFAHLGKRRIHQILYSGGVCGFAQHLLK
jgi:hypothetical protein